jgi:putative phosphoesterase
MMTRIGVLSDTHNNLHGAIPDLFEGVEMILHAGDIETMQLLTKLQRIAPVVAVRGNMDPSSVPDTLPVYRVIRTAEKNILITHRVGNPVKPPQSLRERLQQVRPDVVVFGHTHHPFNETIAGILFFNPGTAGKMRHGYPLTAGVLEIDNSGIRGNVIYLDEH